MLLDKLNKKYSYVGITGDIGSGKTTVSNILKEYGYSVFDTDLFSKQILNKDKSIIKVLENIVGQEISKDYKIDFKRVGQFFDSNPKLEEKFEKWYQVFLGSKIREAIYTVKSEKGIIFFDIPMLNQKGIAHEFDYLWIIQANESLQYKRIKNRNNYSDEKIKYLMQNSKIDKELLLSKYRGKCIDNNYSAKRLKLLVKSELEALLLYLKIQ